jgi:hypothetical protein
MVSKSTYLVSYRHGNQMPYDEYFFEIVETECFEEFAADSTRSYEEATGVGEGHGQCEGRKSDEARP